MEMYQTFVNLSQELATLRQQRATGELLLSSVDQQWHLYLFLGRLLYATGGTHSVRRWQRYMKQYCPDFKSYAPQLSEHETWECQMLNQGVRQNQLSMTQARSVITNVIHEVLFDLVGHSDLSSRWFPSKQHPIALLDVEEFLPPAQQLWKQWQNMGLGQLSPDSVPSFKQRKSDLSEDWDDSAIEVIHELPLLSDSDLNLFVQDEPKYQKRSYEQNPKATASNFNVLELVNGTQTIWDIALQVGQPVTEVASALQDFASQGLIEFLTVPDFPTPAEAQQLTKTSKMLNKIST